MVEPTGLAAIFAAFFIIAVSPGPATLAVSTVSASSGRRNGLLFGAGLGLGLGFWGILAATGIGAVLQSTTQLLAALKIAGGLYLFWLAYKSARSAMRRETAPDAGSDTIPPREGRWFMRGLILNLSNPKAVMAWMAALSVGLGAEDGLLRVAAATLGCTAIGFAIYAFFATAFSLAVVITAYVQMRRWIDGVVAGLYALFGIALLRSAIAKGPAAG
ncbi:LysE family transporter [Acuticoccus sp. MNP-M23]|uniref:LysE family translocator n=1 Tax=Acuticoccus sp. MNP-M23 TaxID=3072793 RepID=UPI0028161216|nr:LysE family transporter [Acuticoccus sp. MNP-M23]WMS44688.1 LysE family transporter [Acuticoccus sp. MNP-M23]